IPRHHRLHHAHHDPVPLRRGPLQARPSFRLRGGGVVLALRRRGVARTLYLRLLAISRETNTHNKTRRRRTKNKGGTPSVGERTTRLERGAFFARWGAGSRE